MRCELFIHLWSMIDRIVNRSFIYSDSIFIINNIIVIFIYINTITVVTYSLYGEKPAHSFCKCSRETSLHRQKCIR